MMTVKWMIIILGLIWFIGFPIFRKIKKKPIFEDETYAVGCCLLALIINLL